MKRCVCACVCVRVCVCVCVCVCCGVGRKRAKVKGRVIDLRDPKVREEFLIGEMTAANQKMMEGVSPAYKHTNPATHLHTHTHTHTHTLQAT